MKRKPTSEISDRAKRYRANQDIPEGPTLCGFCGSTSDLQVGHLDGYEEHGEPENLMWLCRSCNQKQAAVFKAAGLGRRTVQYNPFSGLFKSIFGSRETYRRHGAGHPEERRKAAREKRERLAAERREFVAEKKRERLEKGKPVSRYHGVTIYKSLADPDLPFYTSLDPNSRFETLKDAKAVVGHFRNPADSIAAWSRAVGVLRGDMPASKANVIQAARVVRTTEPKRRLSFLGGLLRTSRSIGDANKSAINPVPTLAQYAFGVATHEKGPYLGRGKFAEGAHDEGGAIIHATPPAKRREYARKMAEGKSARRGEVPF